MSDLHKALADIGRIRVQLAAGTMFRGFGPAVIALSGVMALAAAAAQSAGALPDDAPMPFLLVWIVVAIASGALIGIEMRARTLRQHSGLADVMLLNAVEHFLPFGAVGAVIAAIIMRNAPELAWLLPGLWQLLVGLGLFAATRFLPRTVMLAAAWYLIAGAVVLTLTSSTRGLDPWSMGLPFGVGQLILAVILRNAEGEADAEDE
ncbi:MAG: hypothetical protein H6876_07930 [Hyphomicrobiaceae bacterium]|nr:hypothetical protein [Hyphomicrobiaceae bacterium]MCC0008035.1 hypothetical protein [Hyphomicrobiaceae bacterium]